MIKKDFDSVKLMRDIREKHRIIYENNPDLREKRLQEIRKKYGFKKKKEIQPSH